MRGYYQPYGYSPYQQGASFKTVMIIIIVVIVLIIGIFVYARIKAKNDLKAELPDEYAQDRYTVEESKTIRMLSTAMNTDMKGINIFGHDYDPYTQFANLSDKLFEAVTVDYKRVAGNTLREDLESDSSSFKIYQPWGSNLFDRIITRMNSLSIA